MSAVRKANAENRPKCTTGGRDESQNTEKKALKMTLVKIIGRPLRRRVVIAKLAPVRIHDVAFMVGGEL